VTTVGGGRIVDTRPRRHRRDQPATLAALARLLEGSPDDTLLTVLQRIEPAPLSRLRERAELDDAATSAAVRRQIEAGGIVALETGAGAAPGPATTLCTAAGFEALSGRALAAVREFVAAHPLRPGVPREELRSRLGLPARAFAGLEARLTGEAGPLTSHEGSLDLAGREVALGPDQEREAEALVARLRAAGSRPESAPVDAELAQYLESRGRIVRLAEGVYLEGETHAAMVASVRAAIGERGRITLAEVRDLFGSSRKIAQAFVEDLDRRQVTRRVGDARVLRRG
ncbi:MAG: hypothetical protein F4Y94_11265, partial [Chloroflexi bacterium]|nr:hypothetical protein [Chloroflexota bacterium]